MDGLVFLFLLLGLPAALMFPGWKLARRKGPSSFLVFLLPLPGMMLWIILVGVGVGAQSLANVAELFLIGAISVAAAYLKFGFLDATVKEPRSEIISFALVVGATVLLRLFMPELPE